MTEKFTIPSPVEACCQTLRRAGYAAHPVGGCVRDLLLGREPQDWDVATSARPEETAALFPRTFLTGARHGCVTVLIPGGHVEVTTFRREEGWTDGRRPDAVRFLPRLEGDLRRRDFTINAMALDEEGGIIDLVGGLEDLRAGVIRCVGEPALRMEEDRLRMFRALRFAAQLDFTLHPSLRALLEHEPPDAAALAAERVRRELELALLTPRPRWVGEMGRLGLLTHWLDAAPGTDLAPLCALPPEPLPRWAGLVALWNAPHLPRRLKLERALLRPLGAGYALLQEGLPRDTRSWRHALAQLGEGACRAAAYMALALGLGDAPAALDGALAGRPCLTVEGLALSGRALCDMGLSGAQVGRAQRRLLAHVLDRPEDNTAEILKGLVEGE